MTKNKKIVVTLVVALVFGGAIWAILPPQPDPHLVRVQQLQEKLFDPDVKLTREERQRAFDELRREGEKLTSEQQDQLIRENPPPPLRRMQENIVEFFDLPADQQTAMLDKQIDEFERRRKEWQRPSGDRPRAQRRQSP